MSIKIYQEPDTLVSAVLASTAKRLRKACQKSEYAVARRHSREGEGEGVPDIFAIVKSSPQPPRRLFGIIPLRQKASREPVVVVDPWAMNKSGVFSAKVQDDNIAAIVEQEADRTLPDEIQIRVTKV